MRGLSTLLLLLVSSSMVFVYAGPTDKLDSLTKRLSQLLTHPANAENFNEINRYDSNESYFPKRDEVIRNTPKTVHFSTQTSDKTIRVAEKDETPEDLMATMFKAMLKLMSNLMRDAFKR